MILVSISLIGILIMVLNSSGLYICPSPYTLYQHWCHLDSEIHKPYYPYYHRHQLTLPIYVTMYDEQQRWQMSSRRRCFRRHRHCLSSVFRCGTSSKHGPDCPLVSLGTSSRHDIRRRINCNTTVFVNVNVFSISAHHIINDNEYSALSPLS